MTIVPATRRRFLLPGASLAAVLFLTAGCGMGFSLPGTGKAQATSKHPRLVALAHVSKRSPHHLKKGHTSQHAVQKKTYSAQHRYAVKLLPILDVSTHVFDQAVSAAATSASDSSLESVCNQYGDQITILASQFDGVPHPWPWYTAAGYMHHNWIGIYHYMLGAIQDCQTSLQMGDNGQAATAISDMKTADSNIHSADNYARWLTHQP
jgi:hypothetical protein